MFTNKVLVVLEKSLACIQMAGKLLISKNKFIQAMVFNKTQLRIVSKDNSRTVEVAIMIQEQLLQTRGITLRKTQRKELL